MSQGTNITATLVFDMLWTEKDLCFGILWSVQASWAIGQPLIITLHYSDPNTWPAYNLQTKQILGN